MPRVRKDVVSVQWRFFRVWNIPWDHADPCFLVGSHWQIRNANSFLDSRCESRNCSSRETRVNRLRAWFRSFKVHIGEKTFLRGVMTVIRRLPSLASVPSYSTARGLPNSSTVDSDHKRWRTPEKRFLWKVSRQAIIVISVSNRTCHILNHECRNYDNNRTLGSCGGGLPLL